jgi:sarcosine oxidase, subunit beta
MARKVDAIIVGAGIIGTPIAFELTKKGYKTLNIDKLPAAGYGSTSNTCAVIRTHYSTFQGTAMAYEGYFYWKNWEKYLGYTDERGLAKFNEIGMLLIKDKSFSVKEKYLNHHDALNIPYELWDLDKLKEKLPLFDHHSYYPPNRPDDDKFWEKPTEKIMGATYFPRAGYINDPQLSVHNIQRAAENKGAEFRFNEEIVDIRTKEDSVIGVTLKTGEQIDGSVVVNAAGPHSFLINRMAGIEEKMKIKTRALRHEVHYVPSPKEYNYEEIGYFTSDGDIGGYSRPEAGNMILIGSEDPLCDPKEWVEDPDSFNRDVTTDQWKAQVCRLAKRIPSLPIPTRPAGVVDLYDVADDWIPIYDKSDLKGFYLAIGTSGNQYKTGPMVGYAMAELIDGCEKGVNHDTDPIQVRLSNINESLDMGFYSRLRQVIKDSTFSVLG